MALPKIHTSNLIYMGICVAGMLCFALVGIIPNLKAGRQLDESIAEVSRKVQAQEILHPIYVELIKQIQHKTPAELPIPQADKINKNNLSDTNALLAGLAGQSGVVFEGAVPDPRSYLEDSGQLTINATYSGDFFNFRTLLMNICKLPYLRSIEWMGVNIEGDLKRIKLRLVLNQ